MQANTVIEKNTLLNGHVSEQINQNSRIKRG